MHCYCHCTALHCTAMHHTAPHSTAMRCVPGFVLDLIAELFRADQIHLNTRSLHTSRGQGCDSGSGDLVGSIMINNNNMIHIVAVNNIPRRACCGFLVVV